MSWRFDFLVIKVAISLNERRYRKVVRSRVRLGTEWGPNMNACTTPAKGVTQCDPRLPSDG